MRPDAYPLRQPATPQTVQTPTVVRAPVSPDSDSDDTSEDSDTDSQVWVAIFDICGDVTDSHRFQPTLPAATVQPMVPPARQPTTPLR